MGILWEKRRHHTSYYVGRMVTYNSQKEKVAINQVIAGCRATIVCRAVIRTGDKRTQCVCEEVIRPDDRYLDPL